MTTVKPKLTMLEQAELAIEKAYPVPAHIAAIASACRHDLYNGPSWLLLPGGKIENVTVDCYATYRNDLDELAKEGDIIEETYVGAASDALRDYIGNLPCDLWVDADCDYVSEKEPEGYTDEETGEWQEPYLESTYHFERKDVVQAIFGKTIAKEFN